MGRALVVALLGGSIALSGMHRVLVAHAVCAEHGELMHGDADPHEVARPVAHTSVQPGVAGDNHEHDHCLFGDHERKARLAHNPTPLFAVARTDSPVPASALLPKNARYRIAPKTSPPERLES